MISLNGSRPRSIFLSLLLLHTLCGCGSMKAHRTTAKGTDVHGLRVQIAKPHKVVAVFRDASGRVLVKESIAPMPSEEEHYDLDFTGAIFASRSLKVEVKNGVLKKYEFTSDANVDEAGAALADAIKTTTEAIDKANEKPASEDPLDTANEQLKKEILNRMLEANAKAIEAGRPMPFPEVVGSN